MYGKTQFETRSTAPFFKDKSILSGGRGQRERGGGEVGRERGHQERGRQERGAPGTQGGGDAGAGNAGAGNAGAGNAGGTRPGTRCAGNAGCRERRGGNAGAGNAGCRERGDRERRAPERGAGNAGCRERGAPGTRGAGNAGARNAGHREREVPGTRGAGNAGTGSAGHRERRAPGTRGPGTGAPGTGAGEGEAAALRDARSADVRFDEVKPESATVTMRWEKLAAPFHVAVNDKELTMSSLREQLHGGMQLLVAGMGGGGELFADHQDRPGAGTPMGGQSDSPGGAVRHADAERAASGRVKPRRGSGPVRQKALGMANATQLYF